MTHNSPIFIENLFTVSDTSYDLRGGKTIIQPPVETTTFGLKSFNHLYMGSLVIAKLGFVHKTLAAHFTSITGCILVIHFTMFINATPRFV